ncbi:MAG: hypothetical protein AAB859_00735 [Patescibacteria group bacterium]|mgnify:CR=1
MPKKTRKEKLLASYHRKLRLLENKETTASPVQIKITTSKIIPETKTEIAEPVNQYFFSDLKKSLLLITLIIGVEVGLYFANLIK